MYARNVYQYFYRRTGSAVEAEDLTSEVFMIVVKKQVSVSADHMLPWLYKTSSNVLAHHYRGRKRKKALLEKLQQTAVQTSDVWTAAQTTVFEALQKLNEQDREILLLVCYEQLSGFELGQTLGISEQAARARKSRALQRLKTSMVTPSVGQGELL